jgi:hypothetical protein
MIAIEFAIYLSSDPRFRIADDKPSTWSEGMRGYLWVALIIGGLMGAYVALMPVESSNGTSRVTAKASAF